MLFLFPFSRKIKRKTIHSLLVSMFLFHQPRKTKALGIDNDNNREDR
jgi:hypothetical protein